MSDAQDGKAVLLGRHIEPGRLGVPVIAGDADLHGRPLRRAVAAAPAGREIDVEMRLLGVGHPAPARPGQIARRLPRRLALACGGQEKKGQRSANYVAKAAGADGPTAKIRNPKSEI